MYRKPQTLTAHKCHRFSNDPATIRLTVLTGEKKGILDEIRLSTRKYSRASCELAIECNPQREAQFSSFTGEI